MEIGTVHEIQVGGVAVLDAWNREDVVVHGLYTKSHWSVARCSRAILGSRVVTLSWVMDSADTESSVTMTASFFVVRASRREWARTRAPIRAIREATETH